MTQANVLAQLGAQSGPTFRNRIINGAMVIDQRNAGASVSSTDGTDIYVVDRFYIGNRSGTGVLTGQQTTVTSLAGFNSSLKVTTNTANASLTGSQYVAIRQGIEGYNIADLGWGTANAKTVTLSFWAQSSLTGTFGGALNNSAFNRCYPFSYSIPVANTWTLISITIAGDTTGTWASNNTAGIYLFFGLGAGTTVSGTAGSWSGNYYYSATGATSVVGTSGATFYITGVQLEVGSSATGFEYVNYQTSLANCQRYYNKRMANGVTTNPCLGSGSQTTTSSADIYTAISPSMRTSPTVTFTNLIISDSITFDAAVSAISTYSTSDAIYMGVTYTANGSQYRPIFLRGASSSTTAYLAFSAEL